MSAFEVGRLGKDGAVHLDEADRVVDLVVLGTHENSSHTKNGKTSGVHRSWLKPYNDRPRRME